MCPRTKLIDVIMNEMGLRESAKESGTGKGCIVAYKYFVSREGGRDSSKGHSLQSALVLPLCIVNLVLLDSRIHVPYNASFVWHGQKKW